MRPDFSPSRAELRKALENPAEVKDEGTFLDRFDASALATVLEHEINKARANELGFVRLNMDLKDASALAACLRRATLTGAG